MKRGRGRCKASQASADDQTPALMAPVMCEQPVVLPVLFSSFSTLLQKREEEKKGGGETREEGENQFSQTDRLV